MTIPVFSDAHLREFLADCCVLEFGAKVSPPELERAMHAWCWDRPGKVLRCRKTEWTRLLEANGFQRYRSRGVYWRGVRLKRGAE